jgi:hypothetical protein
VEQLSSIELLRIGFMTPLDLSVHFRAFLRDMAMRNAQIRKMPSELKAEGRVVVRLNLLDSKGEMLSNLLEKLHCRPRIIVIVNPQHAEPSRLVNGGELVEALACPPHPRNEFHIELDGTAGDLERGVIRLWTGAVFLF